MTPISLLRERLRAAGAGPSHEQRVLRLWVRALPQDSGRRDIEDFLPRQLREALPGIMGGLAGLARIASTHPAEDGSIRLLKGRYAVLNMIPYNSVPGLPFRRPARDKAVALARELHSQGVLTKLRNSAGQDVDAGCGQLRARSQPVRLHRVGA